MNEVGPWSPDADCLRRGPRRTVTAISRSSMQPAVRCSPETSYFSVTFRSSMAAFSAGSKPSKSSQRFRQSDRFGPWSRPRPWPAALADERTTLSGSRAIVAILSNAACRSRPRPSWPPPQKSHTGICLGTIMPVTPPSRIPSWSGNRAVSAAQNRHEPEKIDDRHAYADSDTREACGIARFRACPRHAPPNPMICGPIANNAFNGRPLATALIS